MPRCHLGQLLRIHHSPLCCRKVLINLHAVKSSSSTVPELWEGIAPLTCKHAMRIHNRQLIRKTAFSHIYQCQQSQCAAPRTKLVKPQLW